MLIIVIKTLNTVNNVKLKKCWSWLKQSYNFLNVILFTVRSDTYSAIHVNIHIYQLAYLDYF